MGLGLAVGVVRVVTGLLFWIALLLAWDVLVDTLLALRCCSLFVVVVGCAGLFAVWDVNSVVQY